ncbi:MAG TPA: HAD family hydrolase [Anaerolineaceae bacterium]|nr:HAD family hydrolase [Anaerolineaceae bacterium]
MMLKAVFFDMGGTIDTFRYTREQRIKAVSAVRECLSRTGIINSCSDTCLADMITAGTSEYLRWNMVTNVELKPAEIWATYFLKDLHLNPADLKPIAEELAFIYETRLFTRKMRPEIPQVLAEIQKMGLKIGCISNTQSSQQVPYSLKEYGIDCYFDPVVLSSEYGRRKPDPAIFYHAARLAQVPTSACIYIGDKVNRDILGAQRAGFRAAIKIHHIYDNGEPDEGAKPDAQIDDMTELIPLIKQYLDQDAQTARNDNGHKVKAIFFDAGDILYTRPHKDQHLRAFLDSHQLEFPKGFDDERKRLKALAFTGKLPRHGFYEQLIRFLGITDPDLISEGMDAMQADDNNVEIICGAPETILELKERGYMLGIITDTAMAFSIKLNWFDQHGFGRVWDSVISSKEVGARKPDPEMYQRALTQVGVDPCDAVFVGHKKAEIDGAREIGMKTIALNYDAGTLADAYINDIREIPKVSCLQG